MNVACKSCAVVLPKNANFCSNCGGKVVDSRLTLKSIWFEFIGPFFSWENYFWKTLKHLVIAPDKVCRAYTSGARKQYYQPFSFLMVYISISLLFLKFTNVMEKSVETSNININPKTTDPLVVDAQTWTSGMYDNYNFIIIGSIPIMALISYIIFKKRKDNFAEHIVYQSYIQSFVGYLGLVLQTIFLLIFNFQVFSFSLISTVFTLVFLNYLFIRMYKLKFWAIIWANVKALLVFLGIIIVLGLAAGAVLFLYDLVVK
ncbi:MAG: DUF3667 domain-containing protein [Flavobacteriales bacterium]|jgi:hypothetical protein|nr:DUF3667 domain-containing protein [Flavobacteriales bacterium]